MTGTENTVDVQEIKVRNFKELIYLPPENYYACEVLPEDWIDMIPSSYFYKTRTNSPRKLNT